MTFEMWKGQAEAHMELFLRSYGWPWPGNPQNKVNDAIMRLVPEMFRSLDRAGLIPRGFAYKDFYKVAWEKYQVSRGIK